MPSAVQVLTQDFPFHSFLGEEGGVSGNTSSEFLWVVDPLDGTTNFSHAYPSFGVSVAGKPLPANQDAKHAQKLPT